MTVVDPTRPTPGGVAARPLRSSLVSSAGRGPQVFRRSGGRRGGEVVGEELWFWFEGLLGWMPGRVGRLVRSVCYWPFIRSAGALDVAEHTHIRMPWRLSCGRQVSIGRGCQLTCTETVVLGDDVLLAPGVLLVSSSHEWRDPDRHIRDQGPRGGPINIGDDVWIGARAVVLPGVRIGSGAVVATGSVVRADVPSRAVVAGDPARVVSWRGERPDGA